MRKVTPSLTHVRVVLCIGPVDRVILYCKIKDHIQLSIDIERLLI